MPQYRCHLTFPLRDVWAETLLKHVPKEKKEILVDFLVRLYLDYVDLHFVYLDINLFICIDGVNRAPPTIHYLDMVAKLDQTTESIRGPKWAIARNLPVYEGAGAATSKGRTVSVDRGPPMVCKSPDGHSVQRQAVAYGDL